ncbi:MAG: nitroreductase family protein [Stappiaceae bacterium]
MLSTFKTTINLVRAYLYDFARYRKYSFISRQTSRGNRRAIIRIFIHYLEGGMCFPDVRLGYGQDKVKSVIKKLRTYNRDFGADETVAWALSTLTSYFDYHRERDHDLSALEREFEDVSREIALNDVDCSGGSELVTAKQIRAAAMVNFQQFIQNRHSIRQYAEGSLEPDTIRRIVQNAQHCPSVCNRQTCKVYALTDQQDVQIALNYQAGNAGFRQEIQTLFVVTANISEMNLIGERYQGWIDGGIFAMTLALSIHAEGLGACFLNWSTEPGQDRALRKCLGILDDELVITMMSAGHLKPEFRVPVSRPKSLDEVLVLNPPLA